MGSAIRVLRLGKKRNDLKFKMGNDVRVDNVDGKKKKMMMRRRKRKSRRIIIMMIMTIY